MIAGHLQIKNDNYYMVLNYTDANGKRRQPWIPTGLLAKGNKRRAEKLLLDTRKSFVPPVVSKENEDISSDMLFADYMELWLEIIRSSVEKTTFSSYTQMVKKKIAPYFRNTGLTLDGIQAKHIQSFYLHELKTVSPGTVIHYHANIHKALKYAVKMDLIPVNPADKVERPKKQRYIADYYRQEGLERLLEASKDHSYSLLIQMTAFYGLRRSEALGLKWDAIDFERDTITIKHIVTNAKIDGKCEIVCADRAKTKSSLRSLPLVSNIREKLLALREQQKENRRVCGNCYNKKYDGYVFVDAMGNIFNPRSVTANFGKLLEQNGLRHIRFHDLRHPYVKHTTKIFSLRLMNFQAQAYPDARRKTRGACQLHRGGQSRSPVRPLCNRKRFSCLPPQSKMSWILYAISMRLSGYTSTRSISSSASSVVSVSASKIALDASMRLSCRACSSCFCFACANTAA